MPSRRSEARFQADFLTMRHHPFGARGHVPTMFRLGGDAGKPHIIAQIAQEAGLVLFEIIQYGIHMFILHSERHKLLRMTAGRGLPALPLNKVGRALRARRMRRDLGRKSSLRIVWRN